MTAEVQALIRPATAADAAGLGAVCAASLIWEPDAADLPGILRGAYGEAGIALAAEENGTVTGTAFGTVRQPDAGTVTGHVDLIAVAPQAQGRGTGSALLRELEKQLSARGAGQIRIGGNAPVYLWPGVDPRYTGLTCLAERAGYQRYDEAVNMSADLAAAPLDTGDDERRLAAAGITIRRARPDEGPAVTAWLQAGPWGGSSWPAEAGLAFTRDVPGCHLALRGDSYVAFACQGCNRANWFGPTGTLESERRHGIGAVLLRRCLADIRAAGHASAQIGWTGPVRFYARAAGARIDRVFWLYAKPAG